jgi:FkbM family methyltransferase
MLGGRPVGLVLRSVVEPEHYVALAGMARRYPDFPRVAKRYFVGGGEYPYRCRIRTPTGEIAPLVYHPHDIMTVHEIFGREDYRCGEDIKVAVDIGSNIGISALYVLSRNRTSRCYLYEPVPSNIEHLRSNLRGYEERYELQEVAVAARGGSVEFTVESSGRYGGIGVPGAEHIEVQCRHVVDVLSEVLDREGSIDMLKIDTEGAELDTLRAIPHEQLERIRLICFETSVPLNPDPAMFTMHFATETCRLEQRSASG